MAVRHQTLLCLALMDWVGLQGCSSKAAPPRVEANTRNDAAAGSARLETKPVTRPAPRESAFSTYSNSEYGKTFRYPRNYPLDEGPLDQTTENVPGLRSQEQLQSEQPGAVLVATIAVPDDSFPNTTFAGGSVQFAVNRYLPEGGCRNFPLARMGDAKGLSGTITIQGVPFTWADSEEGDVGTEFLERDYAGFANDRCYQFFVRVGVGSTEETGQLKPANQKKILGQLEKVVTSLQMEPKAVSILDQRHTKQGEPAKH
jgi:hypothetical protein